MIFLSRLSEVYLVGSALVCWFIVEFHSNIDLTFICLSLANFFIALYIFYGFCVLNLGIKSFRFSVFFLGLNPVMPNYPLMIQSYCDTIRHKYKELCKRRVWCATDGLKLTLQHAPEFIMQSQYYNGWKHDHYVTSVFVFAPYGTIVAMAFNGPGVIHDWEMAKMGDLYGNLESMFIKHVW